MNSNNDIFNTAEIKQGNLILLVLTIEGILFVISIIWGHLSQINPFDNIYFYLPHIFFALLGSLFLLGTNFLAINKLSKHFKFFKFLKSAYEEIAALAANISIFGALVIAIISGFAEEFFFRGILQEQFGIIISSIIFGLFHIGNKKTVWYGIYAAIIGLYLGELYILTGNLLVPIIVHILNNFLALPYMKYYYRKNILPNNKGEDINGQIS